MLFTSPVFLLFFAVVFLVCRVAPWNLRKAFLLAASLAFYAAWNPPFVLLLLGSVVLDYGLGLAMGRTERPGPRKALLVLSLCGNLGVLAAFKYANFLSENFIALANAAGWQVSLMPWNIVLPVGISFYTFQTLSYTIDVYRKQIPVERNLLDFALFVTFFPQLVAGPIVRASEFLPQLKQPRTASSAQVAWGGLLFIVGLFKKAWLADYVFQPVVERYFEAATHPSWWQAWLATYSFAGQIYCDFSGYSDMAIGIALALGFLLPENFRSPYGALGFSDFWRRWHISLSSWLRDYLYIPLGGNRRGQIRTRVNLALTMLLGGLWHGAAWTFVIWGGWHGMLLGLERATRKWIPAWLKGRAGRVLGMVATFHAVCLGWVFFRAESLDHAVGLVLTMFGDSGPGAAVQSRWQLGLAAVCALGLVGLQMWRPNTGAREWSIRAGPVLTAVVAALMLFLVITRGSHGTAFIYFQF